MRILHIISSRRCGGAEKYVAIIARFQRDNGHSVYFYRNSFPCIDSLLAGLAEADMTTAIHNSVSPYHIMKLCSFIKRKKIDIIHTHLSKASILGGIVGKLTKIPVIATVHGMNHFTDYRFCTRSIAVSNAVKNRLVETGALEKNIAVIHNGVERPSSRCMNKKKTHAGVNFLFVGRLEPEKGMSWFIENLAQFTDMQWDLAIVGAGSQESILRQTVQNAGLYDRVCFYGYQPVTETWYMDADIVVMPSKKEGFGLSAAEAFSYAVPVLASDAGGLPEIVTHEKNGFIFHSGDEQSLRAVLARVFTADLTHMGQCGYDTFIQKFDAIIMNKFIMEEYEKLISNSNYHA